MGRKRKSRLPYAWRPHTRKFYHLCKEIAKQHPDWSVAEVEAEATLVILGIKKEPQDTK